MKTYNVITQNGSFEINADNFTDARNKANFIVRGENLQSRAKKDKVEKIFISRKIN